MATKKRLEITLETDEVLVVRRRKRLSQSWCAQCGEVTGNLTLGEATAIAHIGLEGLLSYVSADKVHVSESSDTSLVCLKSLLAMTCSNRESLLGESSDAEET